MKNPVLMVVLDGWGIGRQDFTNPIHIAKPQNINFIKANYLSASLQASGIAVGLPWNEEGNSEVGHLTLGTGRTVYQHYPKITLSIQKGDFFKNTVLTDAMRSAKNNNAAVNLVGLLSEGNVHASLGHIRALIKLAKNLEVSRLNLHLFTDGKDSDPRSSLKLLKKIQDFIAESKIGRIASITGRSYGLDRDENWTRTQRAYQALTGQAPLVQDFQATITAHYHKGLTDEFIEPMAVGPDVQPIAENDSVIFFNFREDSMRQLAGAFIQKDFDYFPVKKFANLAIATMTTYSDKFKTPAAFPNEKIENSLGQVLADNKLIQLRLAETEKYAHVTYFFNGYREQPFANEFRILIPSKRVGRYDDAPEMMVGEIGARLADSVAQKNFDFILTNFANPDMIAHTGNFDAALQAVLAVDAEIGKLMSVCAENNVLLIITSDHGNVEEMMDPYTGRVETRHDANPVPFYLVGENFKRLKSEPEINRLADEPAGILADVAPTILELMDLTQPKEMTGQSLLNKLK